MKTILSLLLCFVLCLGMQNSNAQSTNQQKKDSLRVTTKDLTVTALRQPENNLEVPLAVTVLSGKDISLKRSYGLDDMLQSVPGVFVQNRSGNQDLRISIRGFGARGAGERSNAGTTRGIRVLVDGIPETEPDGRTALDNISPLAIQSVEILRSNSSALFGNASGGVLSFSTVPQNAESKLSLQALTGSFGLQQYAFQAQGLTDLGLAYLTISDNSFDGWRVHSKSSALQVSGGLVHQVSSRTKFGIHLLASNVKYQIPGPLNSLQYESDPQQSADTSTFNPTFIKRNERRDNTSGRIGITLEHALSDHASLSSMVYLQNKVLQRSERNTFRDFNRYHTGGNIMFRMSNSISQSIHSMLLAGMDYQYQDGAILFYDLVNGNRGNILKTNKREGAQNLGLFLQDEIMIDEDFSLILGGRYDKVSYFTDIYIDGSAPVYTNQEMHFEKFTPKAGVTWKLHDDMSLYANIGGGIEVPAGNETDPPSSLSAYVINPLLKPIQSTSYEIGYKNHIEHDDWLGLGRAVTKTDIAFYTISTTNDIIPYSGGRFYFSAGKTQRAGIEFSHNANWENGFSLFTSITASNNEYVQYTIDSIVDGTKTGASFIDYSGKSIAGIPSLFASCRVSYSPSLLNGLNLGIEYRYCGAYYADDANALNVDSYGMIDASISYLFSLTDHIESKVFARIMNLADTQYMSGVWINPDKPKYATPAYIEPGLPRNIAAGIAITWK